MKMIGIIGGVGPESTVEYYRLLIEAYRKRTQDGSYPPVIVNSINLQKIVDLITAHQLEALAGLLVEEVARLARAGAECGAIAANSPHIVFDEVSRRTAIPLVSIIEATALAAKTMGLTRLGLFGTRFTMQGRFYPDVFSRSGIGLVIPDEQEQAYVHQKYMDELVKGIFLTETREGLLMIAQRLLEQKGIEGLILGGTELPLILREEDVHSRLRIPSLDTTRIHVQAILEKALV